MEKPASRIQVPRRAWILLGVVGIVVLVVTLFEWNWLRGPIASYVGAKVGRPVKIDGDLHVDLSWKPLLTADSVTVGNASWATEPMMVNAQRAAVRVDLFSLFGGPLSLPEVRLVQTRVALERNADGHGNWELPGPTQIPEIGQLDVEDGVVHYLYAEGATDVTLKVTTSAASAGGETPVHFSGSGRLRNNPFTIEGDAASLLALEKANRPYRLNAQARAGYTIARFDGTIVPNQVDNVDGALNLQGRDLSQLYPIIPVPFPWTPPYRLNGRLKHSGKLWTFQEFTGKVGDSDVAGNFALDRSTDRNFVDANLVSTRLDYKDLGGLVGLPPTSEPAAARTPAQNKEVAKRERSDRVLPSKPYDLEKLRIVDAKVRFKAKRFMASNLPLDDMNATLDLKEGVLKLQPLDFGVGGGRLQSTIVLDARESVIKTNGDVTVRNVELKQIVPALKPPNGSAGKVGGRARFTAYGNSIADMLGTSDGEVALISRGGEASALAVILTNLDIANAAPLLIKGDENSPIRCVVADFVAEKGTMVARTLVMDTEAEKILGDGSIDFANERYNLTLNARSKKPSVVALRGPILIDGTFKSPRVHPAIAPIAVRLGASVALGTTLTPLAALLPLIDFGGAGDADCRALIQDAKENVDAQAAGPARTKPSTREAASGRDRQSSRETASGRDRQSAQGESPKLSAAE